MKYKVFLALGSNMGDRNENLMVAINNISCISGTTIKDISGIYETEPVGYRNQGRFLNMVISIETTLAPLKLLKETQKIELAQKRTRDVHWGPRTLDIDILLYGDESIDLPELKVPHPRMFERAFVLIPLKDILNDNEIKNMNIDDLISKCEDKEGIKKIQ